MPVPDVLKLRAPLLRGARPLIYSLREIFNPSAAGPRGPSLLPPNRHTSLELLRARSTTDYLRDFG